MARQYEDSETRRTQVAEAALRTIVEDGVSRFTTKAVAKRVGISDGTLFRHFGSKQEIVLEAVRMLDAKMATGLVSTDDDLRDLETFFRHRAKFVGAHASVGRLVFSNALLHLGGDLTRKMIMGWRAKSVKYLLERLTCLQNDETFRSDLEVSAMSMFVQGSLLTFAIQASLGESTSGPSLEVRIDQAWAAILLILKPPA